MDKADNSQRTTDINKLKLIDHYKARKLKMQQQLSRFFTFCIGLFSTLTPNTEMGKGRGLWNIVIMNVNWYKISGRQVINACKKF